MTLRDAAAFIDEAQDALHNAIGYTDGVDVKECVDEALKPLAKAREAIEEVANDIETAYLILKPNIEV
ncbi:MULTISPECIES: hypothetical protein [unclassified Mesotoga]|uniref:hypothetical protein n=1 Tax=unclassified Mesotoga TaxID=1184398 RepID=UPI000DA682F0|nr:MULTISPECIES: hypothetical protein [unclassified Mesotoga]PZC51477.1 hypothetical protein LH53_10865 [Mesotoga sp. TolDC]